jgi:hypothetical protein
MVVDLGQGWAKYDQEEVASCSLKYLGNNNNNNNAVPYQSLPSYAT